MAQFLRVRDEQGDLRRVNVRSIAEYRPATKREQVKPGQALSQISFDGRSVFVQHSAEAIDKAIAKAGAVVDVG
jgi:hypothetical protein